MRTLKRGFDRVVVVRIERVPTVEVAVACAGAHEELVHIVDVQSNVPIQVVLPQDVGFLVGVVDGQEVVIVRDKALPLFYLKRWLVHEMHGIPFLKVPASFEMD